MVSRYLVAGLIGCTIFAAPSYGQKKGDAAPAAAKKADPGKPPSEQAKAAKAPIASGRTPAGLFGINVGGIPLADQPTGFLDIVLLLVAITVLQVVLFRWRRWF